MQIDCAIHPSGMLQHQVKLPDYEQLGGSSSSSSNPAAMNYTMLQQVGPAQQLDSAYASQWGSRTASAFASGSASRCVSPTRSRWSATAAAPAAAAAAAGTLSIGAPTAVPLSGVSAVTDSCYQSRQASALNSRAQSPTRCYLRRVQDPASSLASAAASAAASGMQSRRMSRAASPERKQEPVAAAAAAAAAAVSSPYAVVLPRGQVRLLDEAAATALCSQSLREELASAESWLQRLDWCSARAFEAASDEAAVMEDEFRSRYTAEPPTAVSDASDDNRIVLADTILSMVEAAWIDEDESENEMKIGGRPMQVHQRSSKPKKEDAIYNVRYKTLPCLHWQKSRACPAGDHCHFAHGPQELRQPQKHPKFKTQICQNFRKTGKCQFGNRCFFKHSA